MLIAIAALAAGPASAQNCSDLRQRRSALENQMTRLVTDYPGIHLVIGACAAGAAGVYDGDIRQGASEEVATNDAMAAFGICAGLSCLLAGFESCVEVTTRWFRLGLAYNEMSEQLARQRCAS